jgi:hypothetical protein
LLKGKGAFWVRRLRAGVRRDRRAKLGGGVNFKIGFEQEEDGRRIAEISGLPGLVAYGATQAEAEAAVEAFAVAAA